MRYLWVKNRELLVHTTPDSHYLTFNIGGVKRRTDVQESDTYHVTYPMNVRGADYRTLKNCVRMSWFYTAGAAQAHACLTTRRRVRYRARI